MSPRDRACGPCAATEKKTCISSSQDGASGIERGIERPPYARALVRSSRCALRARARSIASLCKARCESSRHAMSAPSPVVILASPEVTPRPHLPNASLLSIDLSKHSREVVRATVKRMKSAQLSRPPLVLLSTTDPKYVDEFIGLDLKGVRLVFYTQHTYEPGHDATPFCWHGRVCLSTRLLSRLDQVLVYSKQAFRLFPSLASKMAWVPVNWCGSGGMPALEPQDVMRLRWKSDSIMQQEPAGTPATSSCKYFVSTGYHARDWSGLLDAVADTANTPALRILGAKCPNPHTARACQSSLNRCDAMGPHRCRVEKARLSQQSYIDTLNHACFLALPIQVERMLGGGLTGASEGLMLGKIIVVPTDARSPLAKGIGSQWDGYIHDNETGLVLKGNTAAHWRSVLTSWSADPSRWRRLQEGARELALEHLSLESVYRTLEL